MTWLMTINSISVPQCPSCKAPLEKMPQRKTKCRACGEFIFIKNTPRNSTKRLMTAAQAEAADQAWEHHYDKRMRTEAAALYKRFLKQMGSEMDKYERDGFRSVQVFGGNDRTCSVCRTLLGQVLPVPTPPEDILRVDCERFTEGGYHCALSVSPTIKDGRGNVRFDRSG